MLLNVHPARNRRQPHVLGLACFCQMTARLSVVGVLTRACLSELQRCSRPVQYAGALWILLYMHKELNEVLGSHWLDVLAANDAAYKMVCG